MTTPDHGQRGVREWCDKHRCWYVPSTGPMDPDAEPCVACVMEAEAFWREAEDHNIRTVLGLGG